MRMTHTPTFLPDRRARSGLQSFAIGLTILTISLIMAIPAQAQLNGNYTIGTGGNYTTFKDAVNALETQGVSGPVTFTVMVGTYNGPVLIGSIAGASATNTITFDGVDPNTRHLEAVTNSSYSYVIRLNGADYIRIRNLHIHATGSRGYGVHLTNAADHNEITGCFIEVNATSTSSLCVPIHASSTSSTSADGNWANYTLIENNRLSGGGYGMRMNGPSSTNGAMNNRIINNTIENFDDRGIYFDYQQNGEIVGNRIEHRGTEDDAYGIYAYYTSNGLKIEKNYVFVSNYGIYMYYCNRSGSNRGTLANNMIVLENWVTNEDLYGIYSYYTKDMDIVYNSINLDGFDDHRGVYIYGTSSSSLRSTYNLRFQNNIIRILDGDSFYMYYIRYDDYFDAISNNVFWHEKGSYYRYYYDGSTRYGMASLQSWRPADNQDSYEIDPQYVSARDLHSFYSSNLWGKGTPVASITDDFDGETRDASTPVIGADEFELYPIDVGVTAITEPSGNCAGSANSPLTVNIHNYGTDPLDASVTPVSVAVNIGGPLPQTFNGVMTSGVIPPFGDMTFNVTNSLDLTQSGTYTFEGSATAPGDGFAGNDAMLEEDERVMVPTMTDMPYFEDFEAGPAGWVATTIVDGAGNSWEWGKPNYEGTSSLADPIRNANSGQNAWMTGLTSGYDNNEEGGLDSPCFDLSTLSSPVLTFFANYNLQSSYDAWKVMASSDGGGSWVQVHPYFQPYSSSSSLGNMSAPKFSSYSVDGWKKYAFPLSAFAGEPDVRVRIHFSSSSSTNSYTGVAIDDPAVGDFPQKDIQITQVYYDNVNDGWARKMNENHTVHARILNYGYELNPQTLTLVYKEGSPPASATDGVSQTFTPNWQGSEALVTFSQPHMPTATGPMNVYVGVFYSGDGDASNDINMIAPVVQGPDTYGYEDFDLYTPAMWEKGFTVANVNGGTTWDASTGTGALGSNSASYIHDGSNADDWLFVPAAMLGAGNSYSVEFMFRSRTGIPQTLEVAYGAAPNPAQMKVFERYENFSNTSFVGATNEWGNAPFFNTPNIAQDYYVGFHAVSDGPGGIIDIDNIRMFDNPLPPPKIAWGPEGGPYTSDPNERLSYTGVYKKTGIITETIEIVNETGWYGVPEGDFLWDVTTTASWINLKKSTPDPLTYLATNPYSPAWARQNQEVTLELYTHILPPGTHNTTLDFRGELHNSVYDRGIEASNQVFRLPVQLVLTGTGGGGTGDSDDDASETGLTVGGSPYVFKDDMGNPFATVHVTGGTIPTMTIKSFPGQLPRHLARLRYVKHYWMIEATGSGWTADIQFHYYDSEVLAGRVTMEDQLRGLRIPDGTAAWEDPIMGTTSAAMPGENYVMVRGFNETNFDGMIVVAHDYTVPLFPKPDVASDVPSDYSLGQNYPNPFNPSTSVNFAIPQDGHVQIVVMNSLGEEVARLVDREMSAGTHTVQFNASNLPSGTYFYTMKAGDFSATKTMAVNK